MIKLYNKGNKLSGETICKIYFKEYFLSLIQFFSIELAKRELSPKYEIDLSVSYPPIFRAAKSGIYQLDPPCSLL